MNPYFELAGLCSKNALQGLPYSAMPNAPVLPYVERRPPRVVRMFRAVLAIAGRIRNERPNARRIQATAATECAALSCSA